MITLEKAIEILSAPDKHTKGLLSKDFREALKRGIGAMKREAAYRTKYAMRDPQLLPGETKE